MKTIFITLMAFIFLNSLSVFAEDEVVEGSYEVGHCKASNVMKDESLKMRIMESLPFIGGKIHLGCCVNSVVDACGQSIAEMKKSTDELVNSESWAVCFRAVSISKVTNKNVPRLASDCHTNSCQQWALDCQDVGLSPIRNSIKQIQKNSE